MRSRNNIVLGLIAALSGIAPTTLGAQTVTSSYGTRADPFHGGARAHKGIDIAAPAGTPVFATADGWVEHAGQKGSYGILVTIRHPSGHETRFAHLSRVTVRKGQAVRKGFQVGNIGSTGRSTGPHLHYEVRMNGVALNPAAFM